MSMIKLVELHMLLPTTDNSYKDYKVMVNLEKISYFHPTLDGKYTVIMFGADNRLMVSEPFEKVEELTNWARID